MKSNSSSKYFDPTHIRNIDENAPQINVKWMVNFSFFRIMSRLASTSLLVAILMAYTLNSMLSEVP